MRIIDAKNTKQIDALFARDTKADVAFERALQAEIVLM